MWVNITGYTEAGYVGVSDNEPRTPGAPIALGKPSTSVLARSSTRFRQPTGNPETREYED
jgi:hypothetical protein